jgi:DNA-binding CsgD family transcriptional regulator
VPGTGTAPPELLAPLYEAATSPERWPGFLSRLAGTFGSGTATLRVVDSDAPVVHRSYTVGFDEQVGRRYEEQLVIHDPFREPLSVGRPGVIQCSHDIINDRDYERSAHYQLVFRPNGNFYAMGAHVERSGRRALQIGVHRPRRLGPFQERERRQLEYFSPHLRQAARIMRLVGGFEAALQQARVALDHLPFAVWLLGSDLRCAWMNASAEDAVRAGTFGLGLQGGRFAVSDPSTQERLRTAAGSIHAGSVTALVPVRPSGAVLVLVAQQATTVSRALEDAEGMVAFLLDPERPVVPDMEALRKVYGLTPAEGRLVVEFLQGLDLGEASVRLGISPHTARTQIKSVMQKTGSNRQPDLMRKLLLGTGLLRRTETEA